MTGGIMRSFIKRYFKTLLFFALIGIIGGFFTGLYMLDSYPAEIKQELISELAAAGIAGIPVDIFIGILTALQSAGYGAVLGALGIFFGKKTGLWRDERSITKKPLIVAVIISASCGLLLILPDAFIFGRFSEAILASYATKPSIPFILASVTYGAVIEEVMLRLFFMSLVAFLLHKLLDRKSETPTVPVLVLANIVSSLLFAIGHLPATEMLLGLTPMIIARCIILNGAIGLLFGFLYRKYGLRYAMIAHGGCHVVSKLIWLLFI